MGTILVVPNRKTQCCICCCPGSLCKCCGCDDVYCDEWRKSCDNPDRCCFIPCCWLLIACRKETPADRAKLPSTQAMK